MTRLASRSPPATLRWPTGQDSTAAPEQGPFLFDSLIVRRETASSSVDAASRTKVLSLGKTTHANYQVFRKASEHSATMSVWSSNGKILATVKNGHIVRVNIHADLDEAFRCAMSGNEMSADEGE